MPAIRRVYLLGIGGTGVGALAGLLKRVGYEVRGADEEVYPPMSDNLIDWAIEADRGYRASHLQRFAPDLVVVGNVIRRDNPMVAPLLAGDFPYLSMAAAVGILGIDARHSITVAGTHGKTSTTALISHALMRLELDPSFLVGGALIGLRDAFRQGREGAEGVFVVEGDEYDTAFFDKGPKFVHYRARTAIITSLEFDHADIFADLAAVETAFARLISGMPEDGHLVVWNGAERALALIGTSNFRGRVTRYGPGGDLTAEQVTTTAAGSHFVVEGQGFSVRLWGSFGVDNSLAAIAALRGLGLELGQIAEGLAGFAGVKRRLQVRGVFRGMTVVDDFGHHPTAVRETLLAARQRFPGQRLWALFEPRSATNRRNIHEVEFGLAFALADAVIIGTHERMLEVEEGQRFDAQRLVRRIDRLRSRQDSGDGHARPTAGTDSVETAQLAFAVTSFMDSPVAGVEQVVDLLRRHGRPGDVLLLFSNGDFGGLFDVLLADL